MLLKGSLGLVFCRAWSGG